MVSVQIPRIPRVFGVGLLLALATFAVYSNTFSAPFVLDDASSITSNRSIRQLWPLAAPDIGGTRGRPLVNLSLALNYRATGLDVSSYHWTNLSIHVAAGLVLFGVIRRTLQLPLFVGRFGSAADLIAGGAVAFWMLHPLQTEAVTYVVQRTESLMGLFYFLTLYCFVRARQSAGHERSWLLAAVVGCFAGMACKEVMITAPLAVFLYDRTFIAGSFGHAWRQRSRFYFALASSWIVLAWLMTGLGDRGVGFGSDVGPWHYALTESCVVLRYFSLSVWPTPLVFDYGSEIARSLAVVWPCALLIVMGLAGVFFALRFRPVVGFLVAWPFLTLAPTSSLVPVALQPMAEHRMYLPLAGLAVLFVLGVFRALGTKGSILVLLAAVFLGTATYRRNSIYADEIGLWRDTVAKAPVNGRGYLNLGTAYLKAGRLAEAEAALTRAWAIDPADHRVENNLGIVYSRSGRTSLAVETWGKLLGRVPGFAEAHYNLGCVMLELGRSRDAESHFTNALELNPAYSEARINLAATFFGEGKFREAAEQYSAALQLQPDDARLYTLRAYANIEIGRIAAAIADYERALQLQPDLAEARHNLEALRSRPAAPAP